MLTGVLDGLYMGNVMAMIKHNSMVNESRISRNTCRKLKFLFPAIAIVK